MNGGPNESEATMRRDDNGRRKPAEIGGNELAVIAFPVERFSWDRNRAELVTEASDLQWNGQLDRLYNDACDRGIAIQGRHATHRFVFDRVMRDDSEVGEVIGWTFVPLDPTCAARKVTILND